MGPSDVIPLTVSDVRPLREHIYLCHIFRSFTNEFTALQLPEMHDKTRKQIIICNDNYKFTAIILQKFTVRNVVMVTIHSERFPSRNCESVARLTYMSF